MMMKQCDNRAYEAHGIDDSADSVRRAGGEDPRRRDVQVIIDRKVRDHDESGYNHAYTPEQREYAAMAERRAMGMGTPEPDGTYRK